MGGHRSKSPRKGSGSATKIVYVYGLIVDTFFEFFESRQCPHVVYQRFKLKLATPYMTAKGEQHQAHPAEEAAKVTSEENLSWSSDRERLNFHQMPKTETF